MNQTWWASVWVSVAIGVFVGYAITDDQIEEHARASPPGASEPGIELQAIQETAPAPSRPPESDVDIRVTVATQPEESPLADHEETPAEARQHLIEAQHGFPEAATSGSAATDTTAGSTQAPAQEAPEHDEL